MDTLNYVLDFEEYECSECLNTPWSLVESPFHCHINDYFALSLLSVRDNTDREHLLNVVVELLSTSEAVLVRASTYHILGGTQIGLTFDRMVDDTLLLVMPCC